MMVKDAGVVPKGSPAPAFLYNKRITRDRHAFSVFRSYHGGMAVSPFRYHANMRMTDEQTWAIVTAPLEVSSRELAERLGLKATTVNARRVHLKKHGWTCRVRFTTCLHCGEPLTMPPERSRTDRPYHPECRPHYLRKRVLQNYHAYTSERKAEVSQRAKGIVHDWQEGSIQRAVNRGAPWTEAEDAYLEANQHRTAHELASELSRTFYGVQSRLKRIRRQAKGL